MSKSEDIVWVSGFDTMKGCDTAIPCTPELAEVLAFACTPEGRAVITAEIDREIIETLMKAAEGHTEPPESAQ